MSFLCVVFSCDPLFGRRQSPSEWCGAACCSNLLMCVLSTCSVQRAPRRRVAKPYVCSDTMAKRAAWMSGICFEFRAQSAHSVLALQAAETSETWGWHAPGLRAPATVAQPEYWNLWANVFGVELFVFRCARAPHICAIRNGLPQRQQQARPVMHHTTQHTTQHKIQTTRNGF